MDRELFQDSDGVNESFWNGLGFEFEDKYFMEGICSCELIWNSLPKLGYRWGVVLHRHGPCIQTVYKSLGAGGARAGGP